MRALASQVMPQREVAAVLARTFQRAQAGARRSSSSTPTGASPITSRGAGDRKGRDRHAARQRLQQHQAERVGPARKHEHVGGGIDFGQRLAVAAAEKHRIGKLPLQRRRAPARRRPRAWCRADRARERPRCSFPPPAGRRSERSAAADRASRLRNVWRGRNSSRIDAARPQLHV